MPFRYNINPLKKDFDLTEKKSGGETGVVDWGDIGGTLSNQTDLQNALNSKVNDTGDTMTGNLVFTNASIIDANTLVFNTGYSTTGIEAQGSVFWNDVDGTLDVVLNGVNLHLGQQLFFYGKADGAITKGALVQFAGVQGNHILIKECVVNEIQTNPTYFIGVASEDLTNNQFGYVTWFGYVNNVYTKTPDNGDTADWVTGDILYFSNTTGGLTKTLPTKPDTEIEVCAVVKEQTGNAQNGRILVRPTIYHKLGELSDVDVSGVLDGQVISWQTNKWVNTTVSGVESSTINHNSLFGLQGGKAPTGVLPSGQYFHLSQTEYNIVQATSGSNTGNVTVIDTITVDLTISGQVLQARVRPENITHNSFSEIQGGVSNEYFHLTNSELNVVKATNGVNSGDVSVVDTQSVNLTLSGQQLMADVIPSNINVKDLKGVNFVQPTTSGQLLTYSGLNNELVNITPMFPTFWGLLNEDPIGVATNGYANRNGDTYWYIPEERIQVYINRWRELNGGDRITTENDNSLETENNIYLQANFGQGDYGL
jgi:hypothetical protein